MKCVSWSWILISLSLTNSLSYFKHKDWQWRELPSIFDLKKRQDREDWRWSEPEDEERRDDKEVFRKSETNNKFALGDLKKTSRLAATFNK